MHVHESSKEFQISLDESFPSSNRLKTFKTLPEFAHDSSGFIAPPRYHCFIFSLSQVGRRLNYDVSAIGRVRGCHTSPRPETIRSRGSKDLETKGNAKKNLKRGGGKIRNGAKIQGRTSKGGNLLSEEEKKRRRAKGGRGERMEWQRWTYVSRVSSGRRRFKLCRQQNGNEGCRMGNGRRYEIERERAREDSANNSRADAAVVPFLSLHPFVRGPLFTRPAGRSSFSVFPRGQKEG